MAKCANCDLDSFYTYSVGDSLTIEYCSKHIPRFLTTPSPTAALVAAQAEAFAELNAAAAEASVEEAVVEETPAPKSSKKKADTAPVEEAPVEEAPVDPAPVVEGDASN